MASNGNDYSRGYNGQPDMIYPGQRPATPRGGWQFAENYFEDQRPPTPQARQLDVQPSRYSEDQRPRMSQARQQFSRQQESYVEDQRPHTPHARQQFSGQRERENTETRKPPPLQSNAQSTSHPDSCTNPMEYPLQGQFNNRKFAGGQGNFNSGTPPRSHAIPSGEGLGRQTPSFPQLLNQNPSHFDRGAQLGAVPPSSGHNTIPRAHGKKRASGSRSDSGYDYHPTTPSAQPRGMGIYPEEDPNHGGAQAMVHGEGSGHEGQNLQHSTSQGALVQLGHQTPNAHATGSREVTYPPNEGGLITQCTSQGSQEFSQFQTGQRVGRESNQNSTGSLNAYPPQNGRSEAETQTINPQTSVNPSQFPNSGGGAIQQTSSIHPSDNGQAQDGCSPGNRPEIRSYKMTPPASTPSAATSTASPADTGAAVATPDDENQSDEMRNTPSTTREISLDPEQQPKKNLTAMHTVAIDDDVSKIEHSSFHEELTGETAEKRLKAFCSSKKSGRYYLTRYSNGHNCHMLSVYRKERDTETTRHFKIIVRNERYNIEGKKRNFESIEKLLTYYEKNYFDPRMNTIGENCARQEYFAEEERQEEQREQEEREHERRLQEEREREEREHQQDESENGGSEESDEEQQRARDHHRQHPRGQQQRQKRCIIL